MCSHPNQLRVNNVSQQPSARHDASPSSVQPVDGAGGSAALVIAATPTGSVPVLVACLGPLRVLRSGVAISAWRNRKSRELLAFLATRPDYCATRRDVLAALWPGYDREAARRLLRTALWWLRTLLNPSNPPDSPGNALRERLRSDHKSASPPLRDRGPLEDASPSDPALAAASLVLEQEGWLRLNPARCRVDLAEERAQFAPLVIALQAMETGHLSDVGQYCAHAWLALTDAFERPILLGEAFPWAATLRRERQDRCTQALDAACEAAERAGDLALAARIAERRLRRDPLAESAVARLMRLDLAGGHAATAATRFRAFRSLLVRRYNEPAPLAAPSSELQRLYAAAIGGPSEGAGDASGDAGARPPNQAPHQARCQADARGPPRGASPPRRRFAHDPPPACI